MVHVLDMSSVHQLEATTTLLHFLLKKITHKLLPIHLSSILASKGPRTLRRQKPCWLYFCLRLLGHCFSMEGQGLGSLETFVFTSRFVLLSSFLEECNIHDQ